MNPRRINELMRSRFPRFDPAAQKWTNGKLTPDPSIERTSSGRLRLPTAAAREALRQAMGVSWALVMAWVFFVAARDHHPVLASQNECGTDPRDFLRAGELLEKDSLRFIVNAHCANARYLADGWIELRYNRAAVDVETRRLNIAGTTYYKVVWVGGVAEP